MIRPVIILNRFRLYWSSYSVFFSDGPFMKVFPSFVPGYIFTLFFMFFIDPLANLVTYQWFRYPQNRQDDPYLAHSSTFHFHWFLSLLEPSKQSISICQYCQFYTAFPDQCRCPFRVGQCPRCCLTVCKKTELLISLSPQIDVPCTLEECAHSRLVNGCVLTVLISTYAVYFSFGYEIQGLLHALLRNIVISSLS